MNKLSAALLVLACVLVPAFAVGGYHVSPGVVISEVTINGVVRQRVTGSLMGARLSNDQKQYISCRPSHEIGYCAARDASGKTRMCSSSNAAMLTAMSGTNASSHIQFDAVTGSCKLLEINNGSQYLLPPTSPVVGQALGVQP